ncbi:AarF/ABC1/UbiB kinase family protein [Nocardia stercoris]|uniref:AarF/ABC1/UbiB kinase family protein n=2 Tax=Nocardia stercoris TaxID=2483361 RepID=A0A3M2LDT0_9NOCA|nr:AarF/ABC1/UbiB kinase family protein [Nocardia stercoris]
MIGRSAEVRARIADEQVLAMATQMVRVLGDLKGLAMKFGQFLSMFDLELVPPEHREGFQQQLAALRDRAPAVDFAAISAVIEEDLGAPTEHWFADFDPVPIAAASIGQVHRARLADGTEVVVKVQYPGIDQAVRADLRNIGLLRGMVAQLVPGFTVAVFDEFRTHIESELDYLAEARTQQHVAELYRDHPFICVPQAFPELSSRRVLVTEYAPGLDFAAMRELPAAERDRIGEIVYRFYVGSLFELSEFCGDPHPGNILLRDDGRVVFLDFGLYKRMDAAALDVERTCLRAAAEERVADLYRLLVAAGIVDESAGVSAAEAFDYVLSASQWCLVDDELPITPELACGAVLLAIDPRLAQFAGMKRQNLPPEHLLSRRADLHTFGLLGQLRATANWHRIAREWLYGDPPQTECGVLHQNWKAARTPQPVD